MDNTLQLADRRVLECAYRQVFEYHPVIAHRFIPGLKARIPHESGGYLIRVNKSGFRCSRDFVVKKPPGSRRILLFGDSMTAGDGVSDRQRYGDILETEIGDLEVYNFGLPGTGTDQQYLAYREYATDLDHDLLIIAVLVENIRRVAAHYRYYVNEKGEPVCYAKPYYDTVNGELTLKHVPVPRRPILESTLTAAERRAIDRGVGGRFFTFRRLIIKSGLKEITQRMTHIARYREYDSACNPAWQLMSKILERWINNHAQPVLLMPIPLYYHVQEMIDPSHYRTRFRELAAATGCALYDPFADMLKQRREEHQRLYFKGDGHLNPQGHAVLAKSLAPVVKNLLGIPEKGTQR